MREGRPGRRTDGIVAGSTTQQRQREASRARQLPRLCCRCLSLFLAPFHPREGVHSAAGRHWLPPSLPLIRGRAAGGEPPTCVPPAACWPTLSTVYGAASQPTLSTLQGMIPSPRRPRPRPRPRPLSARLLATNKSPVLVIRQPPANRVKLRTDRLCVFLEMCLPAMAHLCRVPSSGRWHAALPPPRSVKSPNSPLASPESPLGPMAEQAIR